MPSPAVTAIVERRADAASVAWAHEAVGNVAALPDPLAAIAAAAELGNTRALQSVAAPKDLKKAAGAALHKLKSKGVKVEAVAAPRAFVLGKDASELPSRAFLSLPDLQGDQELLLTTSDEQGNCALGIILGAGHAKETRHAHLGRSELREVWKQATSRGDLVEIPYVAGLHYAERFLAVGDHKHDWKHFLEHVTPATLQSARILDPLAHAPTPVDEGAEPDPRWLAPLSTLDEAALHQGIARLPHVIEVTDAGGPELDAVFEETADGALEDGDRAALARASEMAAAALVFHGRPRGAAIIRAQGEAAAAGAKGSSIAGVLASVKLLLLTQAQDNIRSRVSEMLAQAQADKA